MSEQQTTPPGEPGLTTGAEPVAPATPDPSKSGRRKAKTVKVGATVEAGGAGAMLRHPDGSVATAGGRITFNAPGKYAVIVNADDGGLAEQPYIVTAAD